MRERREETKEKKREEKKVSRLLLQANPEHLVVFFTPVKPP